MVKDKSKLENPKDKLLLGNTVEVLKKAQMEAYSNGNWVTKTDSAYE
jgi:hypothetical protein